MDFDSEENILHVKIPSVKPINKNFCGVKNAAGLWISSENLNICGWRFDNTNTKPHTIIAKDSKEIFGYGILNPKICVIRKTDLLRFDAAGNLCGNWVKGDGELKDEKGNKKYNCIRRYLLLFLDENNEPLHNQPLQLTAKGMFQIDFENTLRQFRRDVEDVYAKVNNRNPAKMKDLWHSMWVFQPIFESKNVGRDIKISEACITKSYCKPTECDWLNFCVAQNGSKNTFITDLFHNSHSWIVRHS